ncbi:DUF6090 family protein [Hanstruepera ponticola]|uniref:DUF6090 family protein n=1 Tax=Hanstruepera ponticola TaxID=2042995 RepID=UPI0017822BD3|nr:DUF6090 family protein [Hanstruepera ponticola]
MIKFFRKIRLNLMEQNKTRKYFKYAIGEIILVVIGILIALQINNWNENRKAEYEEQKILKQLKNEYQKNLNQLDEKIYMRDKMTLASAGILNYIDHPEKYNRDSLIYYSFRLTQEPTFDPIQNDLVVSGKLRSIQNDSLIILLSNWTSDVYQVQELETSWQEMRSKYVMPVFMTQDFARNTASYLLKNGYTPDHALDRSISLVYNIEMTDTDLLEKLQENTIAFQSAASTCILYNKIINGQSMVLRKQILKILALLNSEIHHD